MYLRARSVTSSQRWNSVIPLLQFLAPSLRITLTNVGYSERSLDSSLTKSSPSSNPHSHPLCYSHPLCCLAHPTGLSDRSRSCWASRGTKRLIPFSSVSNPKLHCSRTTSGGSRRHILRYAHTGDTAVTYSRHSRTTDAAEWGTTLNLRFSFLSRHSKTHAAAECGSSSSPRVASTRARCLQ